MSQSLRNEDGCLSLTSVALSTPIRYIVVVDLVKQNPITTGAYLKFAVVFTKYDGMALEKVNEQLPSIMKL